MAELNILLTTAITIGVIHTLIGIDHYVPFIALSQANGWSMRKTILIVSACGIGHVLSSVVLGFIGIALSSGVSLLVDIESTRGDIATYFLIAFGLVYTIYGIKHTVRSKKVPNGDTIMHTHSHGAHGVHSHDMHDTKKSNNTLWGLFILFVLGPCEPLIPIIMYPAATLNSFALISVTASFGLCTITTMIVMTFLGIKGIRLLNVKKLERYAHVLAGSAILICGISILVLPI